MHDFNPGIEESCLFWTAPIDRGSVRVNLGDGSASLHVADLEVEDYGNVVNALHDGPSVEATVSFDVTWSGVNERVRSGTPRRTSPASSSATPRRPCGRRASPASASKSDPLGGFGTIGHERNGSFF